MLIQVNIRRVKKLGVAVLKKMGVVQTQLSEIILHFITLRLAGPVLHSSIQVRIVKIRMNCEFQISTTTTATFSVLASTMHNNN